MHLHRLPNELIQNIAFLIVAHDPLGPPKALIPLLLSSKRLHDALLSPSPALKARIFRLKFDTSAVSRRSFSPYDLHLADQLEFYCGILQIIKNKDVYHEDVVDLLLAIYMMMLDNDGKNFAQLQSAGIAEFIDKFIRLRLWEGRMESPNAGWPVASVANRCALWIAWLTMDRRTIFKESTQARDELITLIFPFAILSPRYPSTEAPPNHFHLPLLPESPAYQRPIVSSSKPHQPPYPHYSPHPTMHQYYFGSIQSISPPLISVAAKLLFTARKEIFPITIPPVLPPGLRSEDYAEFNKVKAAEVVRGARWDWDRGCAVAVNNRRLRNAFTPMTNDEFVQFEELINNEVEVIADDDEESRRWDEEWWRRILCGDLKALRPKFPPGLVYKPGTLRGTWQGRLYMPLAEALHSALETYPFYPGYPTNQETPEENSFPTFSEASTSLVMLPVFFNTEEHQKICHCASYHLRDSEDNVQYVHQKGCGTIPVPTPSIYPPRYMRWRGMRPHMVVVPPEDTQNDGLGGVAQPTAVEANGESLAAPETPDPVPLVFGVPSDEVGEVEGNIMNPALNEAITTQVGQGNPNTAGYAYGSVAPAPALPANVNLTPNTADVQPGVQTAFPAPLTAEHTTTQGQQNSAAVQLDLPPPGNENQGQQPPPDLITFLTQQLDIERQTNPRTPRLVPTPVDYSMNNAYFPGEVVPSLMFVKRRAAGSSFGGKCKRDEIVFGFRELGMASREGQAEWRTVDGKCITDKELDSFSGEGAKEEPEQKTRQLYVYETYDPEKESAHDASVCKTCREWVEVRRNERRRQDEACERKLERRLEKEERRRKGKGRQRGSSDDENATKVLEEYMEDYGKRSGMVATGVSGPSSMDFEPLDTRFGEELMDAVTTAAAASDASMSELSDSDSDQESFSEDDDDMSLCYSACDSSEEEDDDLHSRPRRSRRLSVLGDDLPHGEPSRANVPSTRRVFDRTRVGAPEGCSGGVRDIVITGETPRRHVAWHRQMYRLYGRVRSWDGMIGLLRVDERSMPGYSTGSGQPQQGQTALEESEYWSAITNMFICGYVVGGKTFVGEWRMAANDPLKPGWSGPILMSLREREDGDASVWESVGGEAI